MSTTTNIRKIVVSGTDPVKIRRALLMLLDMLEGLQVQVDALEPADVPPFILVYNDDESVVLNDDGDTVWTAAA
jgi:hypothetical protein